MLQQAAADNLPAAAEAATEIVGFAAPQLEARRAEPHDDMLSDIAQLRVDGEPLGNEEAASLAFLLLQAGHETTVGALGGLLYHVGTNREVRRRLVGGRGLILSAIEEALRLEPPLPGLCRTVRQETPSRARTCTPGPR